MIKNGTIKYGKGMKENVNDIIDNCFQLKVEEENIYNYKNNIVKVMNNYSIHKLLCFRVKKSNPTKYNFVY